MKKRTRQTMSRFRIRVIAFVVVFAMALSAAASMPMDVFAGIKLSVNDVYKKSDAKTVEQIVFDNQQLVGEVVAYKEALYYWKKEKKSEDYYEATKLIQFKDGNEKVLFDCDTVTAEDEWGYDYFGRGRIAIANDRVFFEVGCIDGDVLYSVKLDGNDPKEYHYYTGGYILGLSLDNEYLIIDPYGKAEDDEQVYTFVKVNTKTHEVSLVNSSSDTKWMHDGYVFYIKYKESEHIIELFKSSPDGSDKTKLGSFKAEDYGEYIYPSIGQVVYPVIDGTKYIYFSYGCFAGTSTMFGDGRIARAKLDGSGYELIANIDFGGYFSVNEDGSVKGNDSFYMLEADSLNPYYTYGQQVYYINSTNGKADLILSKEEYVPFSDDIVLHYDYYDQNKYLSLESVDIMESKAYFCFDVREKTEHIGWHFNYRDIGRFLLEKDLVSGEVKLIYPDNNFFQLARDNNSFDHEPGFFCNGDSNNGYMISDQSFNILLNKANPIQWCRLKLNRDKTWDGSCFGLSSSIALANNGAIRDVIGNDNYYQIDYDSNKRADLVHAINFYQLAQMAQMIKPDLSYNDYLSPVNSKAIFLKTLVDYAKQGALRQNAFLLGYSSNQQKGLSKDAYKYLKKLYETYGEEYHPSAGHCVVVCGYLYDSSNDYPHRIKIYDPNSKGQFRYMYIGDDFHSFSYVDSNMEALSTFLQNNNIQNDSLNLNTIMTELYLYKSETLNNLEAFRTPITNNLRSMGITSINFFK